MNKFRNQQETKKVGKRIKQLRIVAGYSIPEIAEMTGFKKQTIENIEKGEESTLSYLVEIAKAIGVHPKELLEVDFTIRPRFKLGPQRAEKNKLTERIKKLYSDTNFFQASRFVRDVEAHLKEVYKIKNSSAQISLILTRMEKEGLLKSKIVGRQKEYSKNTK